MFFALRVGGASRGWALCPKLLNFFFFLQFKYFACGPGYKNLNNSLNSHFHFWLLKKSNILIIIVIREYVRARHALSSWHYSINEVSFIHLWRRVCLKRKQELRKAEIMILAFPRWFCNHSPVLREKGICKTRKGCGLETAVGWQPEVGWVSRLRPGTPEPLTSVLLQLFRDEKTPNAIKV